MKPSLKVFAALSAVVLGGIFWFQNKLLYIPVPDPVNFPREYRTNPELFNELPYKELRLPTKDGEKVYGWLIEQNDPKSARTILYFHGNAAGIDNRLMFYHQFYRALDVNILAAEYRGYGLSTGSPSEEGLKLDSQAFLQYLIENDHKIVVFGRSIGAAVAIDLVSHLEQKGAKIEGLVIENTFTTIRDMAVRLFPFLTPFYPLLKKPILKNEWNSIDSIKNIKETPILMISGRQDQLVPSSMMDKLWKTYLNNASEVAAKKSFFYEVELGDHNDTPIRAGAVYPEQVAKFLNGL